MLHASYLIYSHASDLSLSRFFCNQRPIAKLMVSAPTIEFSIENGHGSLEGRVSFSRENLEEYYINFVKRYIELIV